MGKVYTCRIQGAYGDTDVTVDTATGDYSGQTLSCWLPSAGETVANARQVTFGAAGVDPEPAPTAPGPSTGTAQDVADFLGQGGDASVIALAGEHLPFVTATVKAYTRGAGFSDDGPADDLALVIVASTARLVTNPAVAKSETVGSYSITHGSFLGWTLPELAILNRYRKRAL